jgi:acetylornithine deacetylase/succinyl-diaminopimelate desuccinylase-like protein
MKPRRTSAFLLTILAGFGSDRALAQSDAIGSVRAYHWENQAAIVEELVGFLSLPNVAANVPDMRTNAQALLAMMERRGIGAQILETDGPPYVFGTLPVPGATRTVLFYAHFDGQPVDPSRWVGHHPFEPALREGSLARGAELIEWPADGRYDPDWRIYARSASDDKSPIVALLVALDALRSAGLEPKANLKFLFEPDEEMGSPNLPELIEEHGELLSADLVVAADGPTDPSGWPTLSFGARGIVSAEITVYGPQRPLHSGHYGNFAPNPAMALAQLLAGMKDPETGRVRIEGFYDDVVPLSEYELAAIAEAPNDDRRRMEEFGFNTTDMDGQRLLVINQPSLNVRGLRSGWVGAQARTIVPDLAIANIDMRLVKNVDPAEQLARLVAHLEKQGYHVVEDEPTLETRMSHDRVARVVPSDGYPAFRTTMDLPVSRALIEAVESNMGQTAVKLPTSGGSVPLYVFTDVLGVPTIGVPIVNHDNNQHSPNENLRIGNLWAGIEILASAMLIE